MTTPNNPFDQNANGENPAQGNSNPYGGAHEANDSKSPYESTPYGGSSYEAAGTYPATGDANYTTAGEKPKNYMVWAILATVLCCLPLGIVSIIFASGVNSKWEAGDVEGAWAASKKAKTWTIIAAVLGFIFQAAYLVYIMQNGGLEAA